MSGIGLSAMPSEVVIDGKIRFERVQSLIPADLRLLSVILSTVFSFSHNATQWDPFEV